MVKDEIRARVFGAGGFIDADYYTGVTLRGPETAVRGQGRRPLHRAGRW